MLFGRGLAVHFRILVVFLASTHSMPVAPLYDNQKCLQTLPKGPQGAKWSPDENLVRRKNDVAGKG